MKVFWKVALADVIIIFISFILFSALIPGDKRHKIWEKYISSFSKFVIYIFAVTIAVNVITALIVYALRYQRYLNIIAPSVQSIVIGFIASCVPRRGVEHGKDKSR